MKRRPRPTRRERRLREGTPELRALLDQVLAQASQGPVLLNVGHEPYCELVVTGECTCDPTHTVGALTAEAIGAAQASMRTWRKERLS